MHYQSDNNETLILVNPLQVGCEMPEQGLKGYLDSEATSEYYIPPEGSKQFLPTH